MVADGVRPVAGSWRAWMGIVAGVGVGLLIWGCRDDDPKIARERGLR
jgi:hypothetical protein